MKNDSSVNYKATLNLPQTDFPMKASLPVREPEQIARWSEMRVYESIRRHRQGRAAYVLHDGPPYANGHIHMGHVLNKVLKDFIVKYKNLKGYDAHFVPGWDCHGLPIEHQLLKSSERSRDQVDQVSFRKEAHEFALRWMEIQKAEFQRLGVFGDWEHPYLTLDPAYEAGILQGLRDIYAAGHMAKAKKPVYFCPECETALAEAEVEYEMRQSPEVYVKFALKDKKDTWLVIWTTTPWTLPANRATAVHPDLDYVSVEVGRETYWVAEGRRDAFLEATGLTAEKLVDRLKGVAMEGWRYRHPLQDLECGVILSEFVNLEAGTGLVHTAPGHGQEDYVVGMRYDLPVFSPVDSKGRFTREAGIAEGRNVFEANPEIIAALEKRGVLLGQGRITHSYPHCWRSRTPVIFRATEQWFISMDQLGLREKTLALIRSAHWIPESGRHRIEAMVSQRPDWCISRQRLWGVPIPALRCADCGHSFLHLPFVEHLIERVRREGVDCWFRSGLTELSGDPLSCEACGSGNLEKEKDIVDVWFESGLSHRAVLEDRDDLAYPADLYLEGSDQHRGWFQSSLLTAAALGLDSPFREVLTHGFVVDAEGKKMSKSLGNVVDPLEVMQEYGADILRIWVAHNDYSQDIKLSPSHFLQLSDVYRKVRNTFRYLLGNLKDYPHFDREADLCALQELDRYMLHRLGLCVSRVETEMKQCRFHRAWHELFHFCNTELSAVYFNILKDVLYCYAATDPVRQSAQATLAVILNALVRCFAPFIPFTAEEVWRHIPGAKDRPASLFFLEWPACPEIQDGDTLAEKYQKLFQVRDTVLKELERLIASRRIQSSNQARVVLKAGKSCGLNNLDPRALKRFFIVAEVSLEALENSEKTEIEVDVLPMSGVKCSRCWVMFQPESPGATEQHLCSDCREVVKLTGVRLS